MLVFAFVLFPLKLSTQTDGECTMCAEGKTRGCLKCNLKYQGHPQGKLDDHWWRSYKIQTQLSRSYKMQSQLSYRGPLKMETTWSSPIVFVLPLRREGEQIISKIFGLVWFNLDWFGLIWIDLVGFDLSWIKTWKWNQNAHIIQKFPMLIANLSN